MLERARLYVPAPPVTPLPYGLLSAATVDDVADGKWRNGVEFQPDPCGEAGTTFDVCGAPGLVKEPTADGMAVMGTEPFTVYAEINCSAVPFIEEIVARTSNALTNGEGRAVERIFWTGAATVTGSPELNPHLAADTEIIESGSGTIMQLAAETPVTGTYDLVSGIGLLERWMSECYGGTPVLHVPRQALAHMARDYQLKPDGPRYRTWSGSMVAAGAGYPGTGPDGSTPDDPNTVWLYATGNVVIRRSAIFAPATPRESLDRSNNSPVYIAERTYTVGWDCCLFAVQVSLPSCCGSVDGGAP